VDTNRQLYDALLQRYKEIGVAGGIGVNNISVVDSPDVPTEPSRPSLLLNLLIALVGGLVIAAGIAFALEQVDEAIADPSEIPQTLDLALLGITPRVTSGDVHEELRDRKSPISESMLSIQTSLEFSTEHGLPRSLMVTSTRPAEGKSTTSFALAQSLARTDQRVILIDGDMRSPSLHRMLGVPNTAGLSNYLAGDDDLDKLIHLGDPRSPTWMTAGPVPPNAAELLTGNRLAQLLEALAANFDMVVIDAPPVMGLADAPLLASRVEGAIYVIESHATRLSMARIALARLRSAQVHLIGCVLTKFEAKRAHYGYGYDYGYGYGNRELEPKES
jgi:capsular exopolysaccharide synthesis family protein